MSELRVEQSTLGVGNLTNINALADDLASASGVGDRGPGLVFTSAYGQLEQIHDWTVKISPIVT